MSCKLASMSLDCGRKLKYLKRTPGGGIQTPHGKAPAGGLLSVTVLTNTHTHTVQKNKYDDKVYFLSLYVSVNLSKLTRITHWCSCFALKHAPMSLPVNCSYPAFAIR